ncbi:unnamed protein product [Arctia plantaginis]|uniref:Set2 Rpb1 interacting domain-containing protein n=1 Tax=Arctia plantaginis TaxID=874455 RepID=A0A8S0YUA7_ARCPL|nr:unnamed protein product [Arctia plantaginis]
MVVKLLMPYYKKKKISSRDLFKTTARHIVHQLLAIQVTEEAAIDLLLKKTFGKEFKIENEEDDSVAKQDQEIIEEIETDDSSSNSDIKDEKLNNEYITFHLYIYSWEKIQPIVKVVKRSSSHFTSSNYRKKWSLPKHVWAKMLREELWKAAKKPCSWIFKTVSIKAHEFIKFYGDCKE